MSDVAIFLAICIAILLLRYVNCKKRYSIYENDRVSSLRDLPNLHLSRLELRHNLNEKFQCATVPCNCDSDSTTVP